MKRYFSEAFIVALIGATLSACAGAVMVKNCRPHHQTLKGELVSKCQETDE